MSAKLSSSEADYMELSGAKKDADCSKVEVKGGISSRLGCCNEFEPNKGVDSFKCGSCEYRVTAAKDNFFG